MCPRPQEKGSRWDSSSLESRNWTTVLSLLHYSVFIYFVFFLCRLAIWQRVHHFYLHLSHIQQVINCLNLSFKYPERESKCFNFCIYLWFDRSGRDGRWETSKNSELIFKMRYEDFLRRWQWSVPSVKNWVYINSLQEI